VFWPIIYGIELAERFGVCESWAFREKLDIDFLDRNEEFWVYSLSGWNESIGVAAEIAHAKTARKMAYLFDHERLTTAAWPQVPSTNRFAVSHTSQGSRDSVLLRSTCNAPTHRSGIVTTIPDPCVSVRCAAVTVAPIRP